WGFGAFLLVEAILLASAAFVSALLGPHESGEPVPIPEVLIGTMAPVMIAAGAVLVITRVRGDGPRHDLGLEWRRDDVRVGLWCGPRSSVRTTPRPRSRRWWRTSGCRYGRQWPCSSISGWSGPSARN